MEMFYFCALNMVATSHKWPLSPWNMASASEKPSFKISYLTLISFNLDSHMWLVAAVLDKESQWPLQPPSSLELYIKQNLKVRISSSYDSR